MANEKTFAYAKCECGKMQVRCKTFEGIADVLREAAVPLTCILCGWSLVLENGATTWIKKPNKETP